MRVKDPLPALKTNQPFISNEVPLSLATSRPVQTRERGMQKMNFALARCEFTKGRITVGKKKSELVLALLCSAISWRTKNINVQQTVSALSWCHPNRNGGQLHVCRSSWIWQKLALLFAFLCCTKGKNTLLSYETKYEGSSTKKKTRACQETANSFQRSKLEVPKSRSPEVPKSRSPRGQIQIHCPIPPNVREFIWNRKHLLKFWWKSSFLLELKWQIATWGSVWCPVLYCGAIPGHDYR